MEKDGMRTARKAMMGLAVIAATLAATPASADLVLNQVIVDLPPDKPPRVDIDASNTGNERIYVVAEPFEIVDPGKPGERRVGNPDPQALGLLVTPQKMILEPGEHKLVRIASIVPRTTAERIYRVTIKPVAGDVSAKVTALKLLVGYDVLVIVRPTVLTGRVTGVRRGSTLVLTNTGTTNVEIYEGKQCDARGAACKPLAARRLYAGASYEQPIDPARAADYRIKVGSAMEQKRF